MRKSSRGSAAAAAENQSIAPHLVENHVSKQGDAFNKVSSSSVSVFSNRTHEKMKNQTRGTKKVRMVAPNSQLNYTASSPTSVPETAGATDVQSRRPESRQPRVNTNISSHDQLEKRSSNHDRTPVATTASGDDRYHPYETKGHNKGAKGAFTRLIKSFGKESTAGPSLVTPPSATSKRSFKSFDSETHQNSKATESVNQPSGGTPTANDKAHSKRRDRRPTVSRRRKYEPTSNEQQRKWLRLVRKVIRNAAKQNLAEELNAKFLPSQVAENVPTNQRSSSGSGNFDEPSVYDQTRDGEDSNYRMQQQYFNEQQYRQAQQYNEQRKQQYRGAMSTFDDEQSVSSMELLFNWLTCRENSFEEKKTGKKAFNPEGMEFDVLTHSSDPYAQHGMCR